MPSLPWSKKSPEEIDNRVEELTRKLNLINKYLDPLQTPLEKRLQKNLEWRHADAGKKVWFLTQAYERLSREYREDCQSWEQSKNDVQTSLDLALAREKQLDNDFNVFRSKSHNTKEDLQKDKTFFREQANDLQSKVRSAEARLREAVQEEKDQNKAKINSLIDLHRSELQQLSNQYRLDLKKATDMHNSDLKALQDSVEIMKADWDHQKQKMRDSARAEIADLRAAHKEALEAMERETVAGREQMKKDIETLNGALLQKSKFTGKTDRELKEGFLELSRNIDKLSRVNWEFNRTDWADDVFSSSENPKRLKKQLLQDELWAILYETIFCSPFRVLGEEGGLLEAQWRTDSGSIGNGLKKSTRAYIWPEANLEVERWRYETVKNCQDALNLKVSEYDPRMKVKKSFQAYMDDVTQRLFDTLNKVCTADEQISQLLLDIPTKAAKMWLDMGTQRCRILVVVPESSLQLLRNKAGAHYGVTQLVLQAELQRFGNSSGQNLEKKEVISGCELKTENVMLGS